MNSQYFLFKWKAGYGGCCISLHLLHGYLMDNPNSKFVFCLKRYKTFYKCYNISIYYSLVE